MDILPLIHISFSFITIVIMAVAVLQAVLLALQEKLLRRHIDSSLMQKLPPLETMEKYLFRTILAGFLLLSILLSCSILFLSYYWTPILIHKIIFAVLSWIIWGILLLGRFYGGWRGRLAIYATIVGFILLFITYFISWWFVD